MQIVIDILEDFYNGVKVVEEESEDITEAVVTLPMECIANGIPLSKGHGRLGDLDKIKKEMQNYHGDCAKTSEYTRLGFETAMAVVDDTPTIIEADNAESEVEK